MTDEQPDQATDEQPDQATDEQPDLPADESTADDGSGRPRLAELRDVETVYQPAEDSRLLAETAIEHSGVGPGDLVLDVGTGSGYVAARIREETGARVVGSEITADACRQARDAGVSTVRADLVAPFCGAFDLVVCNPPYLPPPPEHEWGDPMERALSGGEDGRAVVNRLLGAVGRVLAPDGRLLLLVSSLTGPDEVRERASEGGLASTVVAEESHPFERLLVLELHTSP